jgi:hypothetical protein
MILPSLLLGKTVFRAALAANGGDGPTSFFTTVSAPNGGSVFFRAKAVRRFAAEGIRDAAARQGIFLPESFERKIRFTAVKNG